MLDPILTHVPEALHTERLHLRCPRPGDGAALHEAVAEALPELRQFIASVPWVAGEQSVQASEVYCRNAMANFVTRRDFPFLIFVHQTGQLVGCVGLHRPVWQTPRFEVGYWCRTSQVGRGYISEAVAAAVQLAEQGLQAARVELITDAENARSRAVALRCGFELEGLLKNERRAPDGTLRNTCVYARTRQPKAANT